MRVIRRREELERNICEERNKRVGEKRGRGNKREVKTLKKSEEYREKI